MNNVNTPGVIVIGAGIIGLSTAMYLQRAGMDVTVIERGDPGGGASYGNAGTIASYACLPIATPWLARQIPGLLMDHDSPLSIRWPYLPRLSPWLLRFALAARRSRFLAGTSALAALLERAHQAYVPLLEYSESNDLVRSRGCLYLYATEDGFRKARPVMELQREYGISMQVLDKKDVAAMEPLIKHCYTRGVLFDQAEHIISPAAFTRRLASVFADAGGKLMHDDVLSIGKHGDGFEIASRQNSITAKNIVVAAGAWSKPFCRMMGDSVPLETERGYHVMFPESNRLLTRPVCLFERGFYMTPMEEGLRVAGTVEFGGLDAPANPARFDGLEAGARLLLNGLGERGGTWLGFRPSLPDSLPVISASPRNAGLFYAFGHGHLGLTLGPLTGRLVADLVTGRTPEINLQAFRVDRF